MPVLATKRVRRLSLGVQELDNILPSFELGDFAVLWGHAVSFISFLLSVRSQLSPSKGGLGTSVVFVDGGNWLNPYLVAEIARNNNLDSRTVLEKIYVSRAFTAYQFSLLILEKIEPFLRRKRSKLLVVSDITSLFLDKDIPKTEAEDLFMKVCSRLSEIATRKKLMVIVTYFPEMRSKRGTFFEAALFSKSNFLVRFRKRGKILGFTLEDHPRIKPFSMDLPMADYSSLTNFMEV